MFSFCVIAYQHERYILQHLESIRYQIETYGQGRTCQLVIADDASRDKTLFYARAWCALHPDLFKSVVILSHADNQGTCKNYTDLIRHAEGEFLKVLAGDDLYGPNDLFSYMDRLQHCDTVDSVCVRFCEDGNRVMEQFRDYRFYMTRRFVPAWLYRLCTISQWLYVIPSTAYRKELLTEEILRYVEQFHLSEDVPLMYALHRDHPIRRTFVEEDYVLYRIRPDSASHSDKRAPVTSLTDRDTSAFGKTVMESERNLLYRLGGWYRYRRYPGKPWLKVLSPMNYLYKLIGFLHAKDIRRMHRACVLEKAPVYQAHIDLMLARAARVKAEIDAAAALREGPEN